MVEYVCCLYVSGHTWIKTVVEFAPLVQPHIRQASIVVVDDLRRAAGKRVRRRLAEHMPDARTGQNFEQSAAHPNLRKYCASRDRVFGIRFVQLDFMV